MAHVVRVVSVDGSGGEAAVHALGTVQHVSGASGAILADHAVVETANREGLIKGIACTIVPCEEAARDAELATVLAARPRVGLESEVARSIAEGDAANCPGDAAARRDQVVGEVKSTAATSRSVSTGLNTTWAPLVSYDHSLLSES